MRRSLFTSVQRLPCLGYRTPAQNGNTGAKASSITVSFAGRTGFPPALTIVLSSLAFILIHRFSSLTAVTFRNPGYYRPTVVTACYTPRRVSPLWISCGMIGVFSPAFLDIFTCRLLKAVFNTHPYRRTSFSFMVRVHFMGYILLRYYYF